MLIRKLLMINTIDKECDFCQSKNIEKLYDVPTSQKSAIIYGCKECGLMQTAFNQNNTLNRKQSLSSDADWGNIRHGKKVRLSPSLSAITNDINLSSVQNVLDVGSNRGSFVNYILSESPNVFIDAIEPDSQILSEYKKSDRLHIHNIRFEQFVTNQKYDLIYCCHTLEHADSASYMLKKMVSLLSTNGLLYIDVPSIEMLSDTSNIQEFFIDKHTFHFDKTVLQKFLAHLGLTVIDRSSDSRNIIFCCLKNDKSYKTIIGSYIETMSNNRQKLINISRKLEALSLNSSVAIYGASQNLNALIKYGNFNISNIKYIIDDYLYGHIDLIQNKKIITVRDINNTNIDYMVLLTKSSTDAVIQKINSHNINVKEFILLEELIGSSV